MRTLCNVAEISLSLAVECYDPICSVAFHLSAPIFFYIILVDCSVFIFHIILAEWSDSVCIIFLEICCCETEHGWNIIMFLFLFFSIFCILFFILLFQIKCSYYYITLLIMLCWFIGQVLWWSFFSFLAVWWGKIMGGGRTQCRW